MLYSSGDVVRSYYVWIENGKKMGILRPVIVKAVQGNKYLIVKISRSNKKENLIRIKLKSKEWEEMGLYDETQDSFIDKTATQLVDESEIKRKLGFCPPNIFCQL